MSAGPNEDNPSLKTIFAREILTATLPLITEVIGLLSENLRQMKEDTKERAALRPLRRNLEEARLRREIEETTPHRSPHVINYGAKPLAKEDLADDHDPANCWNA